MEQLALLYVGLFFINISIIDKDLPMPLSKYITIS